MNPSTRSREDDRLETSRPAHLGALLFASLFPTFGAWLYFVQFAGREGMTAAYSFTKVAQFAFPVIWLLIVQKRRISEFIPKLGHHDEQQRDDSHQAESRSDAARRQKSGAWIGVGFGALVGAAMLGTYFGILSGGPLLEKVGPIVRDKIGAAGITTPLAFVGLAVFYSLAHSGLEELYWRGFVFGQARRVVFDSVAIVGSSIAFTLHHILLLGSYIESGIAIAGFSLGIAVGGAFWAWLYRRTGTLLGCWLGHLIVDAAIMTIGYHLLFGGG